MYIALTYVDTGRQTYAPGEVIEEDANSEWHLKIGAIKKAEIIKETRKETEQAELHQQQNNDAETAAAFADDDVNPEIDIMDGIVKKPTRRKTAKKKGGDEA